MAIAPLIDNFIIDMTDEQNYYFAKAPQGDGRSRFIDVKILEDGDPWNIPTRAFVTIEGHNGGNYNIVNECEVIDSNTIRISLSNGILSFPGTGVYRVSFYESNNPTHTVVGSFNFNIFVSECPYDVIRLEASDEYEALTNLIEKVGETNKWIVGDYDPPFVTQDVNINDLYLAAPTGSVYKYTESPTPDGTPYWEWQFNMKVKIYISYSYEDDHSDMDDDPSSITPYAKYIGIYTGLETDPTQLEPDDYTWSLFRGGIESMEQTTSQLDGADNPIEVTYTDGSTKTLHVHNGHSGSAGGFGVPIVDNTHAAEVGTPAVEVETDSSSPDTAKVFKFTFKQLKGITGERGSKWFKGLQISGGLNGSPIVNNFVGTALVEDLYMNTSSVEGGDGGNVYSCTRGGTDTSDYPGQNTVWELKYTISGGGGGGGGSNVTWTQITPASGNVKIAEIEIDGISQDVYAPSGGGTTSYNDLVENTLPKINNVMLKGSLTSTNLGITWTGTTQEYEDDMALNLIPDGTVVIFTDDFVDPANPSWNDVSSKPFQSLFADHFTVPTSGTDSNKLKLADSLTQKLSNFNTDGSIASGSELDDAITAKSTVVANPTLAGTEDAITGIEIDNVKYKIEGGGGVSGYVLVVTTNSELNGQMLTATKGSNTKRGLVANNQCRISLDEGGIWTIEEPINHHTVNTENLVYYGEYQYKLKSYTIYGFHVDDSKSNPNPSAVHENDMVSYHIQYGGENVDNYNYDYGYMDFANDEWRKGSWSDDEFFMPRPVLLKQDFSDKIYLNPYDLTKDVGGNSVNDKLTGSTDGYNAMMEFGRDGSKIWYKVVPDAAPTSYTVYVSDIQLDSGFHAWSFYDCNDELMEHFYVAIYNGSNVSSVLRSLSGKSILNNVAGTTEISYAKANNKNSETYAWYIDVYADRVLINFLMMLVIRSANSDRIGYGNCTGGSGASSLLQTGLGNTKGFFYGEQANGVVKVFGIENWFANQWRRCAGYSLVNGVIKYKLTYGTADGSSSSGYIESTSAPTNYLSGNSIATNLNNLAIVKETAKTDGSLLPSAFGGSTSTNYCDSAWSAAGTTFAPVGGSCSAGAACGPFCVTLSNALSSANWNSGAALSCKPPIR